MLSPNSTAWLDPPDNSCLLTGVWIFSLQAVISIIFILCQPFKIFRFIFGHSQMWCLISDLISIFRLQTVNEHRSHYPFFKTSPFPRSLCRVAATTRCQPRAVQWDSDGTPASHPSNSTVWPPSLLGEGLCLSFNMTSSSSFICGLYMAIDIWN